MKLCRCHQQVINVISASVLIRCTALYGITPVIHFWVLSWGARGPKVFPQNLCFPRVISAQLPQVLHVSFWTTWLSFAWKDYLEIRCDTLSCSWTFQSPTFLKQNKHLSHAECLLWFVIDFSNSTLTSAVMIASGKGEKYFIAYLIYVGSLLDPKCHARRVRGVTGKGQCALVQLSTNVLLFGNLWPVRLPKQRADRNLAKTAMLG